MALAAWALGGARPRRGRALATASRRRVARAGDRLGPRRWYGAGAARR